MLPEVIKLRKDDIQVMIKNKYDHCGFPDDCTYVFDPKGMKITYSYDLRDIHDMLEIYLEERYGVKPNNFKFAGQGAFVSFWNERSICPPKRIKARPLNCQ